MADNISPARKPNTNVVGFCLDCGPEEEVGGIMVPSGAKRFLAQTGHCTTCGSAATMMPNAVREMTRRLHQNRMAKVAVKRAERRRKR